MARDVAIRGWVGGEERDWGQQTVGSGSREKTMEAQTRLKLMC